MKLRTDVEIPTYLKDPAEFGRICPGDVRPSRGAGADAGGLP
ncbi:MAG: hypothetical protein R2712_30580 [Vicinamibacterales bacterium]